MKHLILGAGPAGVIAAETIRKHAPHAIHIGLPFTGERPMSGARPLTHHHVGVAGAEVDGRRGAQRSLRHHRHCPGWYVRLAFFSTSSR